MEGCSRDVQGEEEDSMKVFSEGIRLAINFWWPIRCDVMCRNRGTDPKPRVDRLCDNLLSCFIQSKDLPSAKIKLKELLTSFVGHVDDNSIPEIIKEANARRKRVNKFQMESLPFIQKIRTSRLNLDLRVRQKQLKRLSQSTSFKDKIKKSILLGNRLRIGTPYSLETSEEEVSKFGMETPSVEIIQETPFVKIIEETNISCSLMQKQANSSEIDDSNLTNSIKVFKEGVGLLMEDLWVRHVFVHKNCGSNPSLMLQELADEILFWFTQTIKPVSFDCIEWILMNELYSLPAVADKIIAISQEVAKKLMVMYEECLQGNFSSVEILREESLSRGMLLSRM